MKKILFSLLVMAFSAVAYAQTAQEIVARMDEVMSQYNRDALAMTMDMKMPLVGTISSRNYIFGKKIRLDIEKEGKRIVTWSDGVTEWTYDSSSNEIVITNAKPRSSEDDNMDMFESVTEGYDVSISEELNDKWILRCKKSRSNKDKDAPKRMDLIVAKDTYFPLSISAKNGLVSVTIRDLKYGITEEDVTFNPENYPTAKFIDKR